MLKSADMNYIRFIALLLLSTVSLCTAAEAEQPAAAEAPLTMDAALEKVQFITEKKPNPHAKYYMFFYTASWCSPCRAVMPKIIDEYAKMMANEYMEVIIVSFDDTVEEALAYLEKCHSPFAAVMNNSEEPGKMPGCLTDVCSVPHIVVVDATGKFIYRGHALRYSEWQQRTATVAQQ